MVQRQKSGNFKVSRDEWIDAARATLIREGIAGVKVERLAKKLGVTRGGFYWFFKSRGELLDALLEDWERRNTKPFFDVIDKAGPDGLEQLKLLNDVWVAERDFSPHYDAAVREWARISPAAHKVVARIDRVRIGLVTRMCEAMGYEGDDAFIRARIIYFHQVGYYSLELHESKATRQKYYPTYIKILSGKNV
jgi:AcrR family transcriptional regulator